MVGEKRKVAVTRVAASTRKVMAPLVIRAPALLLFSFRLRLSQESHVTRVTWSFFLSPTFSDLQQWTWSS